MGDHKIRVDNKGCLCGGRIFGDAIDFRLLPDEAIENANCLMELFDDIPQNEFEDMPSYAAMIKKLENMSRK